MARILEDRVLESTTSTGVGVITLAGAVTGFRRFNAVCAVSDTVPYFIEALDTLGVPSGDYEYGIGTYSGANQLTRTTVQGSSNGGAAVNFAAGTKNVGLTITKSELANQISTANATAIAAALPPGVTFDYTGAVAPAGYVEADGSLLSRATYPALWAFAAASGNITANDAAWSTTTTGGKYSPGDGATTFRVPDARGEFVRGWDHGRGVDAARAVGSNQGDQMQGHKHSVDIGTPGVRALSPDFNNGTAAPTGASTWGASVPTAGSATTDGVNGTPRVGTETRPRSIAWMKIIKT